jgi:hypothetical protein
MVPPANGVGGGGAARIVESSMKRRPCGRARSVRTFPARVWGGLWNLRVWWRGGCLAHCWALRNHTLVCVFVCVVLVASFAPCPGCRLLAGSVVGVLVGWCVDSWIVDASIFGTTRASSIWP